MIVCALKDDWKNKMLAVIGRKYSTWLYIIHPIIITFFTMVTSKLGIEPLYEYVAPIVVYCATLIFLVIIQKVKDTLGRK